MTRIIAGAAKGRRLVSPRGDGTRPTSDRVKEALFARLDHLGYLEGTRVLDLYAGSGSLGLEAASRGADEVVFVEADRRAAEVIRGNVRALPLRTVMRVRVERVERFLAVAPAAPAEGPEGSESPQRTASRFDLALIDPPYDLDERGLARVLELLESGPWLDDDALIAIERSTRSPEPTWPSGWARLDDRQHGETALWFAKPVRTCAV